jgi:hypothetical protein
VIPEISRCTLDMLTFWMDLFLIFKVIYPKDLPEDKKRVKPIGLTL